MSEGGPEVTKLGLEVGGGDHKLLAAVAAAENSSKDDLDFKIIKISCSSYKTKYYRLRLSDERAKLRQSWEIAARLLGEKLKDLSQKEENFELERTFH